MVHGSLPPALLVSYRPPDRAGPKQHQQEERPVLGRPRERAYQGGCRRKALKPLARQHAKQWGIDANRIGVLGFSAGGHLAAAISTHYDKRLYDPVDAADSLSCRPDFAVVIYPGYLALADKNFAPNPDIVPTADTPPTFIVQAEDDPVHVENALVYFQQLKNTKVPAELHIYAQGGHGYGLRRTALPVTTWPQGVETWMRTIKVLPPSGK